MNKHNVLHTLLTMDGDKQLEDTVIFSFSLTTEYTNTVRWKNEITTATTTTTVLFWIRSEHRRSRCALCVVPCELSVMLVSTDTRE